MFLKLMEVRLRRQSVLLKKLGGLIQTNWVSRSGRSPGERGPLQHNRIFRSGLHVELSLPEKLQTSMPENALGTAFTTSLDICF